MADPATVEGYFAALSEESRAALDQVRATIRAAAPDATELISYRMPAFRAHGRILVYYAAFKDHCSLFPATEVLRSSLGADLEPYLAGKGTIRFPADRPLPLGLVTRIVEVRLGEVAARGR